MTAPSSSTPQASPLGPVSGGRLLARWRRTGPPGDGARPRRRWLAIIGAIALPLLLGGCQLPTYYAFRGVTSQSHDESLLYEAVVTTCFVVLALVFVLVFWSVIRYRRRDDVMPKQFQYHISLEIFYTVVPIVMVLVLFGFTVVTENRVDNVAPNPALQVKVTAFQWGWRFEYPQYHEYVEGVRFEDPDPVGLNGGTCTATAPTPHDCLGPGLVMPVGETVRITLISNDVVHGFYVPQFNFSRYALPGVVNVFDFNVERSGIYRAQCTQLCGLYHSQMFFHVVALPPAQFTAWLHSSQPKPDSAAGPIPSAAQSASAPTATSGIPASSSSTGTTSTASTTGTTPVVKTGVTSGSSSTSTSTRA